MPRWRLYLLRYVEVLTWWLLILLGMEKGGGDSVPLTIRMGMPHSNWPEQQTGCLEWWWKLCLLLRKWFHELPLRCVLKFSVPGIRETVFLSGIHGTRNLNKLLPGNKRCQVWGFHVLLSQLSLIPHETLVPKIPFRMSALGIIHLLFYSAFPSIFLLSPWLLLSAWYAREQSGCLWIVSFYQYP